MEKEMNATLNKISLFQLTFLILQTQIGVGVLSLPNTVHAVSKGDAWISTLIAGVVVQLIIILLWALLKRYPDLTIFQITRSLLGAKLSFLVNTAFLAYFIIANVLTLMKFIRVLDIWVLPLTPNWVISIIMIMVSIYLLIENLRIIARFYVAVSFLLIIFFLFVLYSIKDANLLYIMPIGNAGLMNIIKGAKEVLFPMMGFEFILVAFAFTQGDSKGKLKAVSIANIFVTIFYTYLVFMCTLFFSPKEISLLPEPVLYILKAYTFTFVERIDLIFLSIWIISVATSVMAYLYLASSCLSDLLKRKNRILSLWIVSIVVFIFTFRPQTEFSIQFINSIVEKGIFVLIVFVPFVLLLLSLFKGETRSLLMNRKQLFVFMIIAFLFFTTGCWDQYLMKKARIVLVLGFDKASEGKIKSTVSLIPIGTATAESESTQSTATEIISAVGHSPRDARNKIAIQMARKFDISKLGNLLLSSEFAKQDIYPSLDIFYRDPKSSLNANMLLVDGKASEVLNLKVEGEQRIGEYLNDLLDAAKYSSVIDANTIQSIRTIMFDPGRDFVLPLAKIVDGKRVKIQGVALFHDKKYTGKSLTATESVLFQLLQDKKNELARFSFQLPDENGPQFENIITFNVETVKSKLKVSVDKIGNVTATIKMDLDVEVLEYPKDHLSEKNIKKLNKKLSKMLTDHSNTLIKKSQKANSDIFGIGRKLIAFHNKEWKSTNWNDVYPTIDFNADVKVNIIKHGILN